MFQIVFPAFERIDKLPRNAERGVTGIVVHVFEPFVNYGAGIVAQQFDIPAVGAQNLHNDAEMHGQHIGNEYLVRALHFHLEFGIFILKIDRSGQVATIFHLDSVRAFFALRWRPAYSANGF